MSNLTRKDVVSEDISMELRRKFLGGRGLNMYYLSKLTKKGMSPFNHDNPFIVVTFFLPGEQYPKTKLTETETILAGIAETETAYQNAITTADQLLAEKNYADAKTQFEKAAQLKPDEEYPKSKLTEIETILTGIAETEAAYQSAITTADQFFADTKPTIVSISTFKLTSTWLFLTGPSPVVSPRI